MVALQYILLTVIAIGLYLLSDLLLRQIERAAGRVLPERSLVFMGIFFVGALFTFWLVQQLLPI